MDRLFPLTGSCNFIGRKAILDHLKRNYQKDLPSHIQVIGPHYTGKSVLLRKLEEDLKKSELLDAVVYWDLCGLLPKSDDDFLYELCKHLGSALQGVDDEASTLLLDKDNNLEDAFDLLCEFASIWEEEKKKILIIMDGFEKPINSGTLTANLWDRLRHIANDNQSIRLLTGSRDSLRETVRDPASQKSPFFNIFDPSIVRVGCFDEEDISDAVSNLASCNLDKGANTELFSQTNGSPLFVLEILNNLSDLEGTLNNKDIVKAANIVYDVLEEKLEHIWQTLNSKQKEIAIAISLYGQIINSTQLAGDERNKLVDLGFVINHQNKLKNASKLVQRFLDSHVSASSSLDSLFGNNEQFSRNFVNVLELRLGQIEDTTYTRDIKRHIKKSIEDLPEEPVFCVKNLRGIVDEAIEQIWLVELVDGKIPPDYFNVWDYNKETIWDDLKNNTFTGNRGAEMQLLNLITGTIKTRTVLASKLTKRTVSLISGIHEMANFGQHINGTVINVEYAYSAIFSCIEMLNSLVVDFSTE
jgi:AAA+ ATPase superfamily predicted ATPase